MIGVVGIPGTKHHAWRRLPSRAAAEAWVEETSQRMEEGLPAVAPLRRQVLTEQEAARCTHEDGSPVYPEGVEAKLPPGRPPVGAVARGRWLKVRVSDAEAGQVRAAAKAAGQDVSSYVRSLLGIG